jgi:hypothetical protein
MTYQLPSASSLQISGGPAWIDSEKFDIAMPENAADTRSLRTEIQEDLPTLFTALQEQLGLKLASATGAGRLAQLRGRTRKMSDVLVSPAARPPRHGRTLLQDKMLQMCSTAGSDNEAAAPALGAH